MKRELLLFLILGSTCAAVWVGLKERAFKKTLTTSMIAQLCDSSKTNRVAFPTLLTLENEEDLIRYMDVVTGKTNKLSNGIKAIAEPTGFSLRVIGYSTDSTFCKVYIRRNTHSMMKPREETHWIWKGYLCFQ